MALLYSLYFFKGRGQGLFFAVVPQIEIHGEIRILASSVEDHGQRRLVGAEVVHVGYLRDLFGFFRHHPSAYPFGQIFIIWQDEELGLFDTVDPAHQHDHRFLFQSCQIIEISVYVEGIVLVFRLVQGIAGKQSQGKIAFDHFEEPFSSFKIDIHILILKSKSVILSASLPVL